ncbi:MAG TPA: single-stranded DNA-binding protein [Thermoleophilaceae bacterium]
MNTVSVVGQVVGEPELRTTRSGLPECRIKLAVPRYTRGGIREPGVVYVDVTTFGLEARECKARLSEGSRVGLSGRLEAERQRTESGAWEESHGVLIDQLDFL